MNRRRVFVIRGLNGLVRGRMRRWVIATGLLFAAGTLALAAFFQGFEADTAGWVDAMRVPTGTDGVPSKIGAYHAEDLNGNAYTFWGGESRTFPPGGYTTSIDIYLDISPPYMT
ncbi:MAG: hypothetical protein LC775_07020, partial [Acidobacteria bacterium]|nr:hypothetical protein [Acidobacteriota bacterium]